MQTSEVVQAYLLHCVRAGTHGHRALAQRYQLLAGLTLLRDGKTKPSPLPCLLNIRLADGRTVGEMAVSDLSPHILEDWIDANPRWKSSSTRKGKANQVNACFNWAKHGKRIADNPFSGINYPEAERRPSISEEGLRQIGLYASKNFTELTTYLRLVGRRLGEVCAMNWEDIDWARLVVRVTRFKARRHIGKDQYYALPDDAAALLARLKARFREPPAGAVFLTERGKRWTRGNAGLYLRRLKARDGIKEAATIHGIRHAAITAMVRNGPSVKAASLQAGHFSTQITERYYCHLEEAFDLMRSAAKSGIPK